jgi:hypothetical protein
MKALITLPFLSLVLSIASIWAKETPLTDPLLRDIDGLPGLFDKVKVSKTIWFMRQIREIHSGKIKYNAQGKTDPLHGTPVQLLFKGVPQTFETLIALEKKAPTLSLEDQKELHALFTLIKEYFGSLNKMLLVDARGTQDIMIKLIREFCRNENRPHSELLNWSKNSSEMESYERNITNFAIFKEFSTDLLNFLGALILSCPKAYADFKTTYGNT